MADDIIWSLDADGEGTLAVIDQIDASLQALSDSIAMVADSANDFASLDEAMAELSDMTAQGAVEAAALGDALATVGEDASTMAGAIDVVTSSVSNLATAEGEAAASADSASASLDAAGASAEGAAGMFEGLQSAPGPLLMIGTIAGMVGGKLVSMGMDGQKGEALLRGMAGASQQDINELQSSALQLGETMDQASAGFYQVESAGYSGSDAIKVFTSASKLAEGGQASQADMMSGLTAIMHDYNATADEATKYTDYMAEAIVRGKQSAQDFASNIGPLAAAGANVGLSFDQVAAAEATMTQINPHVAQDAQQLRALFQFLSPTMGGVETAAKKLNIAFDEQKYSSLDLIGKLQYLSDIAGGTNTAAFVKLTGGVHGSTAAMDLLNGGASAFKGNLDAMGSSAGATAHAFDQYEATIPAHLDKVGSAFSILGTKLMDAIGPKVNPIIDKFSSAIGSMSDFLTNHIDIAMPILAGLAVMVGVILVAAFTALAIPVLAATWPILAIAAAVGLLVTGVILLVQHWNQIISTLGKIGIIQEIAHAFQEFGQYIASLFVPIWGQLVQMWQTKVMPLFAQFAPVIEPIKTLFIGLGILIATGPVVLFGLLVGVINGVIRAFAGMLSGLVTFIGGIIQLFTGIVQVISGIVAFIVDLVTGHFDKLQADLGVIGQGIINIFSGMWDMIKGAFQAGIGLVVGFVSGFIDGVIGFFTNLWDRLVGHSIVPDMVNGIVSWFEQLPSCAMAAVGNLVSGITGALGGLAGNALKWAGDMIDNFVNGIKDGVGKVGNAIGSVANTVKNFLGFSLPSEGPLATSDEWMPDMIDNFVNGITGNQDKLKAAMSGVAAQMAVTVQPGSIAAPLPGSSTSSGNNQTIVLLSQIAQYLALLVQQSKSGSGQAPNVTFNNTQTGAVNSYQLNQLIQALSGYGYESVSRGGF